MILISIGKLDELAIVTVTLLLAVFPGVNVAVLVLPRDGVEHRHFVTPSIFPVLGFAMSLILFVKARGGRRRDRVCDPRGHPRDRRGALAREPLPLRRHRAVRSRQARRIGA